MTESVRTNSVKPGRRDLYRSILALSRPYFALAVFSGYLLLNILFAAAYLPGGGLVA